MTSAKPSAASSHREFELSDQEFNQLRQIVHRHTGISLSDSKRELVYGRLAKRLRSLKLQTFAEYCALLEGENPDELEQLTNAITTNLTSFFRENHHFEQLAREVLPEAERKNAAVRRLRIWSAGCSTGEEPYSISIVLREALNHLPNWDVRLLATDIDSNVVAKAARGVYAAERLKGMADARRRLWFKTTTGGGEEFEVSPELKRLITFKQLNLFDPWPMRGKFDAIFCRNVVIYFDKPTQRKLFDRMAEMQAPGAWLFIGHSENLQNVTQQYRLVGKTAYRRV